MSIIIIVFSSQNFSIVIINDSLGFDQPRPQGTGRVGRDFSKGFSLKKWVGRDFSHPAHFLRQKPLGRGWAMTTIFSLQKPILFSILNCITHNIVLYYSYQLL